MTAINALRTKCRLVQSSAEQVFDNSLNFWRESLNSGARQEECERLVCVCTCETDAERSNMQCRVNASSTRCRNMWGKQNIRNVSGVSALCRIKCKIVCQQFSCTKCSPGYYDERSTRYECSLCGAGLYSAAGAPDVESCRPCPPGTWSERGRPDCHTCFENSDSPVASGSPFNCTCIAGAHGPDGAAFLLLCAGLVRNPQRVSGVPSEFKLGSRERETGRVFLQRWISPDGSARCLRRVRPRALLQRNESLRVLAVRRGPVLGGPSCAVLLEFGDTAILDTGNHALRLLNTTSRVSMLADNGKPGLLDGRGQDARFCFPSGLVFDPRQKRLIVSDSGNHAFRMGCTMGTVRTIAGTEVAGSIDGPCRSALFSYPAQVVVDGAGLIVVADTGNNHIRVVNNPRTPEVSATTLVGDQNVFGPMFAQQVDGVASEAHFKDPTTLALDRYGRLLVVEKHAPDQIRIVDVGLEPPVCFYDVDPNIERAERMESRGNALMKALDDLGKPQDDTETADVVFVVGGERVPAYRVVISQRCTYLSNTLKFHGAQKE